MLIGQVLKYFPDLDDPLAADPMSDQGAVRPGRAIDEHILDTVLLKEIGKSVHDLKGHSPPSEHPDVRDARHILIQAL